MTVNELVAELGKYPGGAEVLALKDEGHRAYFPLNVVTSTGMGGFVFLNMGPEREGGFSPGSRSFPSFGGGKTA